MNRLDNQTYTLNVSNARAYIYSAAFAVFALLAPAAAPAAAQAFSAEASIRALQDSKPEARGAAADALGGNQASVGVEPLLAALGREQVPSVRAAMISALGAIRDRRAVPALAEIARRDADLGARTAALSALSRIGGAPAIAAVESLAQDASQPAAIRAKSLDIVERRKGHASLGTLSGAARSSDPVVRREAIRALGRIRDPRAEAELQNALSDKDPEVRKAARTMIDRRSKKKTGGKD